MSASDPLCSLTEYSVQFKRYQAKKRQSFRPKAKSLDHDAKIESITTNRNDYVSHPITPPPPKPVVTYKPPEGMMDGSTEYKELYQGKWAVPAKQMRPRPTRNDNNEPFDHKSTNTVEYVVHTLQPREWCGPKNAYETPREPFDGISTVKTDFVDYGSIQPPKSLKPQHQTMSSDQPFGGVSSYRHSFTPPAMPARFQRAKPVYAPSDKAFSGDTTFKVDFPAPSGMKPTLSCKPPQNKMASDQPFESKTTSRMSYTKWELPSKVLRPPVMYVSPAEKFAVHTTYGEDFPIYGQFGKTKSFKPNEKREEMAPFQGVTSHSNDYKTWSVQKTLPIRSDKRYTAPTEKFDGISTAKAHYIGEFSPKAASTKPQVPVYAKSCAMDGRTSYRDSYTAGYQPCPGAALVIDVNKHPGYDYSHEDSATGHKFFSQGKDVLKIAVETVA